MLWVLIPAVIVVCSAAVVFFARQAIFRLYTRPIRITARQTPADFALEYKELTIEANGGSHPGWLMHPSGWNGSDSKPLVIVQHGFAAERSDMLLRCAAVVAAGCLAYSFDWRAHGKHSEELFSGGVVEQHDLAGIVDYFDGQPYVDGIALYGFSYAAAVSMMVAAAKPTIRCVVADSPFDTLENAMRAMLTRYPLGGSLLLPGLKRKFAAQFGMSIATINTLQAAPQLAPRPLLLLTGSADKVVPSKMSRAVFAAAEEPKRILVQEGGSHFDNATPELLLNEIIPFLEKHLQEAEQHRIAEDECG